MTACLSARSVPCSEVSWGNSADCVGEGATGQIVLCREGSQTFVRKEGGSPSLLNEVAILKELKGVEGVIQWIHDSEQGAVLEYAPDGNLAEYHRTHPGKVTRGALKALAVALGVLHGMGIIHRDVKPQNVLVFIDGDGSLRLKWCDFDKSCHEPEGESEIENEETVGTPFYLSPEALTEARIDGKKADVWAFGVMLYYLATGGKYPHQTGNNELLTESYQFSVGSKTAPQLDRLNADSQLRDLIEKMLCLDPAQRPTMAKVAEDPWFEVGEGSVLLADSARPA